MKGNVVGMDRILRIALGLALIVLASSGTVGAWGYIGIVPIFTGSLGWCPAYLPFGFSTCKAKSA